MKRNDELIIEDFERLSLLDKMYLEEQNHQMIVEWQQYEDREEYEKLLPAVIEVVKLPKLISNEPV